MRRIQRAVDKEPLVKALTTGENPIFREIFRLIIFSAMLGFKLKRREHLADVDSGKSIPETYFANSPVWPGLLYLLGVVETSSTSVLGRSNETEDELLKIFEEYANGGLSFLKDSLPEDEASLPQVLQIMLELQTSPSVVADLSGITI